MTSDIIVCVKRVPDTETRVRFSDGATVIDPEGVKYIVSPYDEFALEAAFRTTEAYGGGQVTVITLGDEDSLETLRVALAAGADAAVLLRVRGSVTMDGLATAKTLAMEEVAYNNIPRVTNPWMEAHTNDARAVMGDDIWPYGFAANRVCIEAFLRYHYHQGLAARELSAQDLFVPSTLARSKI